jgi:hypothetical protein
MDDNTQRTRSEAELLEFKRERCTEEISSANRSRSTLLRKLRKNVEADRFALHDHSANFKFLTQLAAVVRRLHYWRNELRDANRRLQQLRGPDTQPRRLRLVE